jgi:hypothetical protein
MPEATYEIEVTLKTSSETHAEFILGHMEELLTLLYPNNVVNISARSSVDQSS